LRLYRVCPFRADATAEQPGHPLFVPHPKGAGRIDSPASYSVLYLSSAPGGAVAEAFGSLPRWTAAMFDTPSLVRGSRALATYDLADPSGVLDLDDPDALKRLGLRPSDIVTRDRLVTQRWALAAYREHRWIGVRWWSYYDPRWHSYGLWDISSLRLTGTEILGLGHAAIVEAAGVLGRPLEDRR